MPAPQLNLLLDGDTRLDAGALALLSRLELREGEDGPSVLALRFRLAQRPEGDWYPLDEDLFTPARELALELVPPGGSATRVFVGYVSHVRPHFESVEANCYVEILAFDRAALMDVEERQAAWPDKRDSEIASEVFSNWELDAEVVETSTLHEEKRMLQVQRESDWQLLQRLARRNGYRCWLEIEPGASTPSAYFGPLPLTREVQPDLTILRGDANLVWLDMQQLALAPIKQVGAAIDPLAKRVIRSAGEAQLEALGDEGMIDAIEAGLSDKGVGAAQRLLRDPWPHAEAIATQGDRGSDELRFVVEARGELDPSLYRGLLRAHRPVLVKGVGRRFVGKWWVERVRTVLDEGVLRQTFVLRRNELGLAGDESFGQSAEEVEAQ